MRYFWVILIYTFFSLGMVACQPESPAIVAPESIQAQTVPSTQAPEETEMVSPITPDATAQQMVALAKEHLARKLGISVEQIALSEVKPVQWRDASLGCPKPGIDYIRVETAGYSILLEAGGKTYNYHTDEVNRVVPCNTQSRGNRYMPV